jgi:23S rRNA pseudouridine1911/1915/1917 synthase
LDVVLARRIDGLSRTLIQRLMKVGRITVNGARAKSSRLLQLEDKILVRVPPPEDPQAQPEAIALDVVFEDDDVIVVNKPAGMVVHPAPGNPTGTLVNALLHHCGHLSSINGVRRPGIVHRIDKDTTGLLIAAKNDTAHAALADQLFHHTLRREYLALVSGTVEEDAGEIEAPIGRDPNDRMRMAVTAKGRRARTHWRIERRVHGLTLLRLELDTGRTHQVRVHCAHVGHPVIGDPLYGCGPKQAAARLPERAVRLRQLVQCAQRQMLHAGRLTFSHPRSGQTVTLEAPVPEDFARLIERLDDAL